MRDQLYRMHADNFRIYNVCNAASVAKGILISNEKSLAESIQKQVWDTLDLVLSSS